MCAGAPGIGFWVRSDCEVRAAHTRLLEKHRRVAGVYAEPQWDPRGPYYDYDTAGEGHHRFHPDCLPDRKELLPLSKFGTDPLTLCRCVNHGENA